MKILVTGADGFLGRAVVGALAVAPSSVVPVTRRKEGSGEVCDLASAHAVTRLLNRVAPDCIVNLAAVADFSPEVLPRVYPVNTLCPAILAGWCRTRDAYLVQASMAIHGRGAGRFGPQTPGTPETDYGRSKWLADEAIVASGCRSAIVRLGGIFGSNGPRHLGLNRAIEDARAGSAPRVVGTGAARRNYVHVDDAAAGIARLIGAQSTGLFYAGGETMSIRAMLQAVCDVWLPGREPVTESGSEASDQLVDVSHELGPVRPFRSALEACR